MSIITHEDPDPWLADWTKYAPFEPSEETLMWLRSRPEPIQNLLLLFPPKCTVHIAEKTTLPMLPARKHGIVASYSMPVPKAPLGLLCVALAPTGEAFFTDPRNVEACGYHKGLTPEVVNYLMNYHLQEYAS